MKITRLRRDELPELPFVVRTEEGHHKMVLKLYNEDRFLVVDLNNPIEGQVILDRLVSKFVLLDMISRGVFIPTDSELIIKE